MRAGIQEVHFLPFNPTDKRTALTYIDGAGKMHRAVRVHQSRYKLKISIEFLTFQVPPQVLSSFAKMLCRFSIWHVTNQRLNGRCMTLLTSLQNVDYVPLELPARWLVSHGLLLLPHTHVLLWRHLTQSDFFFSRKYLLFSCVDHFSPLNDINL